MLFFGELAREPRRVGKPLRRELTGYRQAKAGLALRPILTASKLVASFTTPDHREALLSPR